MCDSLLIFIARMEVFQAFAKLFYEETCLVLWQGLVTLIPHVLVEGDATNIFLDQIYFL